MGRFANHQILVTGAGSGIGAATAKLFAEDGGYVVGLDLDERGLERTSESIAGAPGKFVPATGDIVCTADRERALALFDQDRGLDVLVNNAAVFLMASADASAEQWRRTLEVNLVGTAAMTSAALPYLRAAPAPAVVNIASISAHVGQTGRWTYNSSKAGVLELTRCQALDFADLGIRVNSVSPGWIWTEVLQSAADDDREHWEPIWGAYCPMHRCGEPVEVARAIRFLASTDASFITGSDLPVDGGYLIFGPEGGSRLSIT